MKYDLEPEAIEVVEAALDEMLAALVADGLPLATILQVMHGNAVLGMTMIFGGDFAASRCRIAAAVFEGRPPASSPGFATARPIGRA